MEKTVYEVTVKTKHFMADFFNNIRNLLGLNLVSYENLIKDGIEETLIKLYKKHPNVYDIKITTAQMALGACEIIIYGKVKCQQ